jgi:AcrR family transcriptional regulator
LAGSRVSRTSDATRQDLVDAAVKVFAGKGFEAGSIRDIVRIAQANQAAVSYHFGGKDGLYREVLRRSVAAFDTPSFDVERAAALDRDDAVRAFLGAQLSAIRRHSEFNLYLRIFAWENVSRTAVFQDFVASERLPIMDIGATLVRRFLPDVSPQDRMVAILWLLHQAEPFTRDPTRLARPPIGLSLDAAFIERLSSMLSIIVIAGLEALAAELQPRATAAV